LNSKRVKISFETVNQGNIIEIKSSDIHATNQRVKIAMKQVVRKFEKNDTLSNQQASKLVLNS
jgi:hypothetical protein